MCLALSFGLPSDREQTFDATAAVASRAEIAFAQFVMLTPYPGTVDFIKWEKEMEAAQVKVAGNPITRCWLIPLALRPKLLRDLAGIALCLGSKTQIERSVF